MCKGIYLREVRMQQIKICAEINPQKYMKIDFLMSPVVPHTHGWYTCMAFDKKLNVFNFKFFWKDLSVVFTNK